MNSLVISQIKSTLLIGGLEHVFYFSIYIYIYMGIILPFDFHTTNQIGYGYIFIYHIPFEFHIKSGYFNSDSAENMGNTLFFLFFSMDWFKGTLKPENPIYFVGKSMVSCTFSLTKQSMDFSEPPRLENFHLTPRYSATYRLDAAAVGVTGSTRRILSM